MELKRYHKCLTEFLKSIFIVGGIALRVRYYNEKGNFFKMKQGPYCKAGLIFGSNAFAAGNG